MDIKVCELCSVREIETGAYGDRYRTPILNIEVESDAYKGSYFTYNVCQACADYLRSSK